MVVKIFNEVTEASVVGEEPLDVGSEESVGLLDCVDNGNVEEVEIEGEPEEVVEDGEPLDVDSGDCVCELLATTTSEELTPVEVSMDVENDVETDVLSSIIVDEDETEVTVITVLDTIGVTTVDVASVVTAVVLVDGGTDPVPLELAPALFANSTKVLATSGAC